MAVEVNLETIIEAFELADDSISSFLDVETGEVHSILLRIRRQTSKICLTGSVIPSNLLASSSKTRASDTWLFPTSLTSTSELLWTAFPNH